MKLIRPIKKGKKGIFFCSYCNQEVEKWLSNGKKDKSCGCMRYFYSHGETGTRLFGIWQGIKKRCFNINSDDYKNYGGRGITVCQEWLEYIPFRDWALANGYKKKLLIDRINNNGNYEPQNCRWTNHIENNRNSRNTKLNIIMVKEIREKYKTKAYSTRFLGNEYGVSKNTISNVINNEAWV